MKCSSNLYLIGPMGAGKSTVGKRLARSLGLRFIDLDEVIEDEAGSKVPLIFELQGEAAFRARKCCAGADDTTAGRGAGHRRWQRAGAGQSAAAVRPWLRALPGSADRAAAGAPGAR